MKCPAGHKLPHETKNGQCTPLYCGEDGVTPDGTKPNGKVKKVFQPKMKSMSGQIKDLELPTVEKQALELRAESTAVKEIRGTLDAALGDDEVGRAEAEGAAIEASKGMIGRAGTGLGAFAIRQAFLKIPKNMSGEDAENWAQAKSVELLPTALGEVEFRLKFGTDDQRYEAAKDVLDMNGMRKRDAINSGGNTIILNIGAGGTPWAKKIVAANVTEGEVVSEKK